MDVGRRRLRCHCWNSSLPHPMFNNLHLCQALRRMKTLRRCHVKCASVEFWRLKIHHDMAGCLEISSGPSRASHVRGCLTRPVISGVRLALVVLMVATLAALGSRLASGCTAPIGGIRLDAGNAGNAGSATHRSGGLGTERR